VPNIYLDHQAATPLAPEVFEAMRPFFTEQFGNASSLHQHGLAARDALARVRGQVAKFINAESADDILFTSDGTESVNLAIKGTAWANQRRGNHLVVSATEHPAVLESVAFLEGQGFTSTKVRVDAQGRVDPDAVRAALTEKTVLIAVHHANHDVGTIQPIQKIGELAVERGITFFVDAEASAGWLPIYVQDLGATLLSFSPHRFHGPKGVGVLYRNRRARVTSLIHGGLQEGGRRAGVENVPAIVGAGAACELAGQILASRAEHAAKLQKKLWDGLSKHVPLVKLNGPAPGPDRLPNNLHVSFEFVEGEGLLLMLDAQGIAVASGTSCVSKALKISPVLAAMGLNHGLALGSILLTLGAANTLSEMESVLATLPKVVSKLRGMSPMWDEYQSGAVESVLEPRRKTESK
jgi:cysteine desulfurase